MKNFTIKKIFLTIIKRIRPFTKYIQLTKICEAYLIITRIFYMLNIVMQFCYYYTLCNDIFTFFNYKSFLLCLWLFISNDL